MERTLRCLVSSVIALTGIGLACFFFLKHPSTSDAIALSAVPVYCLLLNKYYVDELYDSAVVHPIQSASERVLWKIVDADIIDGAVNGAGTFVSGTSSLLRRLQSGSVRGYAVSLLVGVVAIAVTTCGSSSPWRTRRGPLTCQRGVPFPILSSLIVVPDQAPARCSSIANEQQQHRPRAARR